MPRNPVYDACTCCQQPIGCEIRLAGVIISQSCYDEGCSFMPCTTLGNLVCEPSFDFKNFSQETHCLKYLVETSINNGRTTTNTFSRLAPKDPKEDCIGPCQIRTCCSGQQVTTTDSESKAQFQYKAGTSPTCAGNLTIGTFSGSAEQKTKVVDNYSCSGCTTFDGTDITEDDRKFNYEQTRQCQGSAKYESEYNNPGPCTGKKGCEVLKESVKYDMFLSNTGPNSCAWSGTFTRSNGCWANWFFDPDYWTDDLTGPLGVYPRPPASDIVSVIYDNAEYFQSVGSSNGSFYEKTTVDVQPPESPITTNKYSEVKPGCDLCKVIEFPVFPNDVLSCKDRAEGKEPPELKEGQGYGGTEGSNYANYGGYFKSYTIAKVRLEHTIPATCYLKVWLRETTRKYKTGELSCIPTEEDGPPTFKDYFYEWKGTNGCNVAPSRKTCLKNCEKPPTACENEVFSDISWMLDPGPPENGKAKTVSLNVLKYSLIPDYIPDDPDKIPYCNPDGFPNPELCKQP